MAFISPPKVGGVGGGLEIKIIVSDCKSLYSMQSNYKFY